MSIINETEMPKVSMGFVINLSINSQKINEINYQFEDKIINKNSNSKL